MQIQITLPQTTAAFAQWWADVVKDPDAFDKGPDLEGKSTAECFFEYASKFDGNGKRKK